MLLVNELQLIQSAFSGRFTDLAQFVSNCFEQGLEAQDKAEVATALCCKLIKLPHYACLSASHCCYCFA